MPDQSSDMKKNAIKIAMGAALGGALGIVAALRKGSNEQRAGAFWAGSNEVGAVREPFASTLNPQSSSRPGGARNPQYSPDHPDWEPLPAAHLPRPTYWPVVLAVGIVFLAWGIVTTIAITVIGLALLALGLGGWIGELRHDH